MAGSRTGWRVRWWGLVGARYPAVAVWAGQPVPPGRWSPWVPGEFAREAQAWLELAETAQREGPGPAAQAALFARWAYRRIQAGVWRRPAMPVRHLRQLLWAGALAPPPGFEPGRLLAGAAPWLRRAQSAVGRGGEMADREMAAEITGVYRALAHLAPYQGRPEAERLVRAVDAYRSGVLSKPRGPSPTVPWLPLARADEAPWREARARAEIPEEEGPPAALPPAPSGPAISREAVPGLEGCWVRTGPEPRIFCPPASRGEGFLAPAEAWARWRLAAAGLYDDADWLTGLPATLEGRALAWLAVRGPDCTPLQQAWAEATADAWLWLDGGDAGEVARWLERAGHRHPEAAVVSLSMEPGRALARWQAYREARERAPDSWAWGPMEMAVALAWEARPGPAGLDPRWAGGLEYPPHR